MYKILISALVSILILDSEIFSQSSSELIQTGFSNYQNGDYQAALIVSMLLFRLQVRVQMSHLL